MAEDKPRDFWRYPLGEEDLIRFDVPKEEKLLRDKLCLIHQELNLSLEKISSDMIFNEIIKRYPLKDQNTIQNFLYTGEVYWNNRKFLLSEWIKKGIISTLKVVKDELDKVCEIKWL